jgi:hypothetical protein
MPEPDEFHSEGQTDIATADNQNTHDIYDMRFAIDAPLEIFQTA